MASGGTIPDQLWIERAKRRNTWLKAQDDVYNYFDQDALVRTIVKRCRAEIAEVHDTALRWRAEKAVGYRKIAGAYWDIYAWTDTITNLQKAHKYLRIALRKDPENWLHYANLGVVLEHLERPQQALVSYHEALRLVDDAKTRTELKQKCVELTEGLTSSQASLDFTAAVAPAEDDSAETDKKKRRIIDRERIEGVLRAGFRVERTRDRRLREEALAEYGPVCMKCGFDPRDHYPPRWALQAVEVHHVTPISKGPPSETQMDEVWVLCANCHNVIHAWLREGAKPDRPREAGLFSPVQKKT